MMKQFFRNFVLFTVYGLMYGAIEILYRGYTHWTMLLLGGLCGILVGLINEKLTWEMGIIKQGAIGTIAIVVLEFIAGYILNIKLGLGIWDYSNLPLNIMGQICLPFIFAWFFLALVAIVLDDVLRWKLFNEEKPHYHLFDHEKCGGLPDL